MPLENFLALCAVLLVFGAIIGVLFIFAYIDKCDQRKKQEKEDALYEHILHDARQACTSIMQAHLCNFHCTHSFCDECDNESAHSKEE